MDINVRKAHFINTPCNRIIYFSTLLLHTFIPTVGQFISHTKNKNAAHKKCKA